MALNWLVVTCAAGALAALVGMLYTVVYVAIDSESAGCERRGGVLVPASKGGHACVAPL